jgi:hypothetical protein
MELTALAARGLRPRRLRRTRARAYSVAKTHGACRTRLYRTWTMMRFRCRSVTYPTYAGKGVRVCDEWQDFVTFRDWAHANGYADDLTIDRIDVDGDYCPGNCEWVTRPENTRREMMRRVFKHVRKGERAINYPKGMVPPAPRVKRSTNVNATFGAGRDSKTHLYSVWKSMRQRCSDGGNKYYAGKGVRVCPEWLDFWAFKDWAFTNGYLVGLSIERKNTSEGYSPENCEWVTRGENSRRAISRTARNDRGQLVAA